MSLIIWIFQIWKIYLIKLFICFDNFATLKFQMNHGHVNKYYVLGDSHRLHCIFTCKTQSWPCIFLKHFVKTAKVFLALKAHTNKTCCTLEAHSAILFFWLQSSHLSKDELVGPTGRKILLLRKEVSHLRKPEGHMFTEWKKKKIKLHLWKLVRVVLCFIAFLCLQWSSHAMATAQGLKGVVAKLLWFYHAAYHTLIFSVKLDSQPTRGIAWDQARKKAPSISPFSFP